MKYLKILFFLLLCSCGGREKRDLLAIMEKWKEREIIFPENPVFTVQGKDTVDFPIGDTYKIMCYVDTIGCVSCRLQLPKWKEFMATIDSLAMEDSLNAAPVQFLFFFVPKKKIDVYYSLRTSKFTYPVCIDEKDSLNRLNHFLSDERFQTFLLDKDNRVLVMGNPVHNPKIKELYLRIITGKEGSASSTMPRTSLTLNRTSIDMGTFDWQQEQTAEVVLTNSGDYPLVIEDVITSCGCTKVEYGKEPLQPGKIMTVTVRYKAEHPEHFNKTVTVYCNAQGSPVKLKVSGDAI